MKIATWNVNSPKGRQQHVIAPVVVTRIRGSSLVFAAFPAGPPFSEEGQQRTGADEAREEQIRHRDVGERGDCGG